MPDSLQGNKGGGMQRGEKDYKYKIDRLRVEL